IAKFMHKKSMLSNKNTYPVITQLLRQIKTKAATISEASRQERIILAPIAIVKKERQKTDILHH
ncbi:MAG: hypothetical protein AAFV28_09010, partial [Cyanobacteria bacterium J06635_13]